MNWVSTNQGTYSKVVSVYYIHMIVESLYKQSNRTQRTDTLEGRDSNTTRMTNACANRFEVWQTAQGLPHPLHKIKKEELDIIWLQLTGPYAHNGMGVLFLSRWTMVDSILRTARTRNIWQYKWHRHATYGNTNKSRQIL